MVDNSTTFTINARDNSSRAFRSAQKGLGSLGLAARSVAPLLGAIGGVAVVRGLTRYASETLKAADETIKMSRAAGISAQTMQEMAHAANISGISTDALQKGLTRFNKTVGETKAGTGTLITLLRKMPDVMVDVERSAGGAAGGMKTVSVSLHDALVQAKDSDQALDVMLGALTKMTDQSKIAALAGAAFGRQMGPKMANLIMDGERGIAELRAEAHHLGVVLDDQLLMNAEAANDALDRLGKASSSLGRELVLSLAPSLADVAEGVVDVIKGFRQWSREADEMAPKVKKVDGYFKLFWGTVAEGLGLDNPFGDFGSALAESEKSIQILQAGIDDLSVAVAEARRLSVLGLLDDQGLMRNQAALRSLREELERSKVKRQELLNQMGGGVQTIEITSGALDDQAVAVSAATSELDSYIDALREDARVNALSAREKRIHNAVREAEKRGIMDVNGRIAEMAGRLYDEAQARKRATAATKEQGKALASVRAEYERNLYADRMLENQEAASRHASIRKWREYKQSVMGDIDSVGDAHGDMVEMLPRQTEAATGQMSKIWDNAVRSMQSSFSDTIYNLLWEDGISSFKDFGKALVDIFKRAVAEMVAAWATSKITGWLGGLIPGMGGAGGVGSAVAGSAVSGAIGGGIGGVISGVGSKIAGAVKSALGFGGAASGSALASGSGAWTIGSGGAAAAGAGAGAGGALLGAAVPVLGAAVLFESLFGTSNKQWKAEMAQFNSAVQAGVRIDDTRGIKSVAEGMQGITLGTGVSVEALEEFRTMLGYTTSTNGYFVHSVDQVTGERYVRVKDSVAGLVEKYDALIAKAQAANSAMSVGEIQKEISAKAQVGGLRRQAEARYENVRGKGDGPFRPGDSYNPEPGESYSEVLTELQRRAQRVKVGMGKEAYYTTVGEQEDRAARNRRERRYGGGKRYGGISSGSASGHLELLHGREAVIPLGDGNRLRAPVQLLGSGGDAGSELLPVLRQISDRLDRLYDIARRDPGGQSSGGGDVVREIRALGDRSELLNNRLVRAVGRQSLRRLQTGGIGERVLA